MPKICILGASTAWTPTVVTDLMCVFTEPLEIRLVDINPKAAALCAEWCEAANRHHGRNDRFLPLTDRREGLAGADAVIITLAVGGLKAMGQDIAIPEKYGIYATVGDTTGPSGWSRAVRNIPVYRDFARDFQEICPQAFIINYSNPMAALTATLQHCCDNPVLGLCHSYFETRELIQKIFGLETWDSVALSFAGMNHFTWVTDFRIGREDGYKLLREKIGNGSLRDVLPDDFDKGNIYAGQELCADLYDTFGYLPYPGDRHISEFVSFALSGNVERYPMQVREDLTVEATRYCNIRRTPTDLRAKDMGGRERKVRDMISGAKEMPKKSRETGAEMIHGYLYNKPIADAVNVLNVGQLPQLPLGACVETFGVVDGMGVRPVVVDNIAEPLLEIMRPQAACQKWLTQGVLENDKELLLHALYRDPQCAHLKPHEVRAMAQELLESNQEFLAG